MSQDNPRHAFSHALVAGTAIWCVYNTHRGGKWTWEWIYGTYAPICLYSFLGVWRYGNPQYGEDSYRIYDYAEKCVMAFALPAFVTELYLHYGYETQYALIHAAVGAIPIGIKVAKDEWEQDLIDSINMGCIISGSVLSVMQDNYYGLVANLSYLLNHFILKNRDIAEVPNKVLYNAGLCFFLYYSYKALSEASVGI